MHDEEQNAEKQPVTVGLVADPGVPTEVARKVSEELPQALADRVDEEVDWSVCVHSEELTLDEHGNIPTQDKAEEKMPEEGWDLMVCLTDLPRRDGTRPVVADISAEHGVGVASLPAIGWMRLRPHVAATIVHLVGVLARDTLGLSRARQMVGRHRVRRRPTEFVSPVRQIPAPGGEGDLHLMLVGVRGRLRLLFGMVRDNRPWLLVPSLSKAIAAASATAAFGIFYPTIWSMADSLSAARLTVISVFAIAMTVIWLIVHNGLWERTHRNEDPNKSRLYNAATITTVSLGVICMYVLLLAITMVGSSVVISASYLGQQLGHPVGVADYAMLAWLSTSMGTVAGALGSSLESESAVRRATYSKREQERRARRRREIRQSKEA